MTRQPVCLLGQAREPRPSVAQTILSEGAFDVDGDAAARAVALRSARYTLDKGDPQTVIRSPEVADIYLGIAADA